LDVVPAHIADDLETVREHLANGRLAVHAPATRLGAAGHQEGCVLLEKAHDAVHVTGVEGGVDVQEQLDARAGGRLDHGGSLLSEGDAWATLCPPLVGTSRVTAARLESQARRC